MHRTPGSRIGPYEIVGSLGAGGMGEVYRARDAKLDRHVAIKVLPQVVAADVERRARFEREARALAALNHPNIAQIYGVEEVDGGLAIVMELVEGEDLAARIGRRPLAWPEAQPIARQLAEALDAAHERNIVHRDLKPANVRLTPDETVKVLDFGLAKAVNPDTPLQDPAMSPTFTSPPTHLGSIVGTAAYMAPEQAKGKSVDKRADIWAFGCVLFEMLTGRSPFASDSAAESLGLVVMKDPDWAALPPSVPPRIVDLLRRCLAKDPKQRLRDIGDAAHVIADPGPATIGSASVPGSRRAVYAVALLGVVLAAAAATAAWSLKPSRTLPLRRLELPAAVAAPGPIWISPDGTQLAYVSGGRLMVRRLSESEPQDVADAPPTTERIFWSPDSRSIGFAALGTIRTVSAAGGPVFTVCRIPGPGRIMGVFWRTDGSILFAAWRDSLYTVAATGGEPKLFRAIDPGTEVDFHEISAAPGGRLLVTVHLRKDDAIRTDVLEGTERRLLAGDATARDFRYVEPGYLMFRRFGENQGLWAVRWAGGTPNLAEAELIEAGTTSYSASNEGTLVVRAEVVPTSTLAWIVRSGRTTTTTSIPGSPIEDLLSTIAVSPQGDRVVYVAGARPQTRLLVRDLSTGIDTQLNAEGNAGAATDQVVRSPGWFPRGDRLIYAAGGVEATRLFTQRADGAGEPVELERGTFGRISSDGKWLVWTDDERGTGRIRFAPIDEGGKVAAAARSFPLLEKLDIRSFDLSPDSRLLAFTVRDPTGPSNVHLINFPEGDAKWQVTTAGGTGPRFAQDGRELFFMSGSRGVTGAPEGRLMVMSITTQPAVKLGTPGVFLAGDASPNAFDTAPDGRLLIARRLETGKKTMATLVQNWPALLRSR